MDNIHSKLLQVLKRVTGQNIENINMDADLKSQLHIDSIQIVELFAALEKELGIELPLQLMTVRTGKAFLEMLDEQIRN